MRCTFLTQQLLRRAIHDITSSPPFPPAMPETEPSPWSTWLHPVCSPCWGLEAPISPSRRVMNFVGSSVGCQLAKYHFCPQKYTLQTLRSLKYGKRAASDIDDTHEILIQMPQIPPKGSCWTRISHDSLECCQVQVGCSVAGS